MKIRLSGYDKKWSKLIRQRDDYTCQYCGKQSQYVNAHHVKGRRIKSLRFCLENGISLCFGCHKTNSKFSAHATPEAFKRWIKKRYSLRWEIINRLARKHMTEREAIKKFKEEYEPTRN